MINMNFFIPIFILLLSFNSSLKAYYVPCEPSIASNNTILKAKIMTNTNSINKKSDDLKSKYEEYYSKLQDYNKRLESYRLLQKEKNILLTNIKNNSNDIKNLYFLGLEK